MKRVIDLLKKSDVMTLATSWNDKPRASILEPYVVGEDAIVFATDPNSIKANNLKHNKQISFSVLNMPEMVTVDGVVTEPSAPEIEAFVKQLLAKHPEFKDMTGEGVMVYYKVIIDTAYYCNMEHGAMEPEVIKG